MAELPAGWVEARLGDLVGRNGLFSDGDWVESKDQDPNGSVRLVQLADIGDGWFRDRSNRFLTAAKAAELGCTFLSAEDVLIARMPEPIARACIFPRVLVPCVTVVDVAIVRPDVDGVDARWLMWAVNAPQFRGRVSALQSGTTRSRISRKNLATIEVLVPPIAEQRRIVASIEEQFSRLDAAEQLIRMALPKIRPLIASAVATALGSTWPLRPLADVATTSSGGTPSRKRGDYFGGDIPWVKSGELRDGPIRATEENLTELGLRESSAKVFPEGTLLIALYGATVGRLGVLGLDAATNQAVCAVRPKTSEVSRDFLMLILRHKRSELTAAAQGGAQPNISQSILGQIEIPLPPLEDQRRIVAEVEAQLSRIDAMRAAIERAQRRSAALRRSILERAFRGDLVPQDPSDEPAGVLLERIAAART